MPEPAEAMIEAPAKGVRLTSAAAARVRAAMERAGSAAGTHLRIGVRGGGCSGYSYALEFDGDVDPDYDDTFECEGVPVVIDRRSLRLLTGTTVDWTGELLGQGFMFHNPNASRSCGCGESFQV